MPVAKNLRILMVDDQPSMRGLARYSLQQMGIRDVVEAADGYQALEHLKDKQFDLIISDWIMAGVDGLILLKTIRANPIMRKMPFIMATGQSDADSVRAAVQAGVSNYLVKPYTVMQMKQKIEAVIGKLS